MTIEEQLRTLIEPAATPIALDEIDPATLDPTPQRRRTLPVLVGAIAVLIAVTGVVLVAPRPREVEPQRTAEMPGIVAPAAIVPPKPVPPAGQEYPLESSAATGMPSISMTAWERLGSSLTAPAVADGRSLLRWRTADGDFVGYRTIQRQGSRIVEVDCVTELDGVGGSSTGCIAVAARDLYADVSISWTVPPGAGTWMWTNVPDGTDYVQYRSDGIVLWQRPVDGLAAFPATGETPDVIAIAYRSDGAILAATDPVSSDAAWRAYQAVLPDWFDGPTVPDDSSEAAGTATAEAFATCFADAGHLPEQRPTVPPQLEFALSPDGVGEANDLWASCVSVAQAAFDSYLDRESSSATTQVEVEDTSAQSARCSGGSRRRLPDLAGLPEATAVANLTRYVNTVDVTYVLRSELPDGRVISQTPAAGELIECDTTGVRLVVSTHDPGVATTD